MKMFRLLIALLVFPFMCISCEDEPTLVADIEDANTNGLTGTRWIMLPQNINIDSESVYKSVASIEFFGSKKCLFNFSLADYTNQPITLIYNSEYNEETNKGNLLKYNVNFIVVDNELFLTEIDHEGVPHTLTFTKETDYVAPSKDCPLIGFWQGEINKGIAINQNATYYLNIIDNQRLIFYDNFTGEGSHFIVLEYQFDGKTLSFKKNNQINTFKLKKNKLESDFVTLTKSQYQ